MLCLTCSITGSACPLSDGWLVTSAAMMTWWLAPQVELRDPYGILFLLQGVMPLALTVFAMALTLAVGVLGRRTISALIVTLVLFFIAIA